MGESVVKANGCAWRKGVKCSIVGGQNITVEPFGERLSRYGSWEVVRADDHSHLICAFYGASSLAAASAFFEMIEAAPGGESSFT